VEKSSESQRHAEVVEHLPSKHKALTQTPRNFEKELRLSLLLTQLSDTGALFYKMATMTATLLSCYEA
jgi:hypothetical protein